MRFNQAWWDKIKDDDAPDCCGHHRAGWDEMIVVLRRERMRADYPVESEELDEALAIIDRQAAEIGRQAERIAALQGSVEAEMRRRVVVGPADLPEVGP